MSLQEKLKTAEQLFKASEYDKAASLFTELFIEQPANHSVLYKRGHCYFRSKQYSDALHDFNIAIELNDKLDWYYGARGSLHLAMKNPEIALEDFSSAITLNCSRARHYYGLGRANLRLKNYQVALDAFNTADKLGIPVHWEMKVNCLMFLKKLEEAVGICNEEIKSSPKDYRPYLKKGVCLHYLGWKRMEDFIHSNKLNSIEDMVTEGEDLLYNAIEFLSMAIHLNDKSETAYRYRGISYNLLHEYRQAYEDFNVFVDINTTDDFINRLLLNNKKTILGHSGLEVGDKVKYLSGNAVYSVESINGKTGKILLKNGNETIFECYNKDKLQKTEVDNRYSYYYIPDLPNEHWSILEKVENILVSDYGRVKNIKNIYNEKLLKTRVNSNGDYFIKLKPQQDKKSKYKSLPLQVAKALVPNPNNYKFVQHINSDLSDNTSKNLMWIISGAYPKSPTTEYFEEQKKREDKRQRESNISSRSDSFEIDDPEFYYYGKRSESTTDWLDEETDGFWRWNID